MKRNIIGVALYFICFATLYAADIPSVSKAQSQMRVQYTNVQKKYEAIHKNLSSHYAEQIRQGNDDFRIDEFTKALSVIRVNEGKISILPSDIGVSRVWHCRKRSVMSEFRPGRSNYLSGPENEIIIHNGELLQNATDMTFPTRGGLGFSFRRIYLSNTHYSGPLGNGWDFNYNARIIFNNIDNTKATQAKLIVGGVEFSFSKKGQSIWESAPGNFYHMVRKDDTYYVYDSQLFRMEFELSVEKKSAYRLVALASRHGNYSKNRITLKYQPKSDRLAEITDPYGHKIFLAYNKEGRIIQIATDNQAIFYSYDKAGNLSGVDTSDIALSFEKTNKMSVRYGYNSFNGRYLLNRRLDNNNNSKYHVEYDEFGRVTRVGQIAKNRDSSWQVKYAGNNVIIIPAKPSPEMCYEFSNAELKDLPTKKIIPTLNAQEQFEYSYSGLLTKKIDALGVIKIYTYDTNATLPYLRNNLLCSETISIGGQDGKIVQKFSYIANTSFKSGMQIYECDVSGKTKQLLNHTYKYSKDWEVSETNENGIVTRYFYNSFGQLALTMDANNRATINYYAKSRDNNIDKFLPTVGDINGAGLLVKTISDASRADLNNACASLKIPNFIFNDILRVQPVALTALFSYDKYGNLIFFQKGSDISLTLYNRIGDQIAFYSREKGIRIIEWSNEFKKKTIKYQFAPVLNGFQGEDNHNFAGNFYSETFEYDSLGYIRKHFKTNEKIDGKDFVFNYQRYPNGIIKQIIDPSGLIRVELYNTSGLLAEQKLIGSNSRVTISSEFEYFPNGIIKSFKNAIGDKTSYNLDAFGRNTVTVTADGNIATQELDGINRILNITTTHNNTVIAKQEYSYYPNGMLSAQIDYLISGSKSEKIETRHLLYDAAGNIIAEKKTHEDGWSVFLLDGLNRPVATMLPSGDIKASVYSNDKTVMTILLNNVGTKKYRPSGAIMLLNSSNQICVSAQVSANWECVEDKSQIFTYSPSGFIISTLTPGQTDLRKDYNSLGMIIREENIPQNKNFGEKSIITDYEYTSSGQLKKKTLHNTALMITGSKDSANVELVSAPQITNYYYDDLARQSSIQQPDGLIVEKIYNKQSLPVEMRWYHATDRDKLLRHIKLDYGKIGRLTSITDLNTQKIQRKYSYDVYGNCVSSTDLSGKTPIATHRKFNSFGLLIEENTYYGERKLPGFSVIQDIPKGLETLYWENIPAKSSSNWQKQTIQRDALGRVKKLTLDNSNVEFASWKYMGVFPLERKIPESHITARYTYSQLDELIETDFFDASTPYGNLCYNYDSKGNMLYSATSLAPDSINRYSFAQYMDYNSFRQLVAQNGESVIPVNDKIKQRWQQVLYSQESIQATKTSRNVYDQAENIWALYNGNMQQKLQPCSFHKNNLSCFLSPGSIIKNTDKLSPQTMFELASNRDTTQATLATTDKLTAEENIYDLLGNLKQFKGEFWNGERTFTVNWNLTFDTMGRLVSMKGFADSDYAFVKKDQLTVELFFEYDADNRRISKTVKDYSRTNMTLQKQEFTIYCGNNQAMVIKDTVSGTIIQEQYLWNADTKELLMAALPENKAENNDNATTIRYYFQQDKSLNTVCVTKSVNGRVNLVTGASYLGFGKNATIARIVNVNSSMSEEKGSEFASFNKQLDDGKMSVWKNLPDKPQYMEIKLAESENLGALKIWTDETFPTNFLVFVLPEGVESPNLSQVPTTWINNSVEKGFFAYQAKDITKATISNAISVPLHNMKGNRIVLVWDRHNELNINVREFEVTSIPKNPGSIAFAGQWLDRETNMYYQINRYKLAGSSKFISPDPIGFLDGNNLYAYAKNNPLEWHDPDGEWAHIVLGAVGGALINSGVYAVQCWITGEDFSWKELAIRAGTGAIAGGIAAATFGVVNPLLAGWGVNATVNIIASAATAGFTSGFASGSVDTLLHGGSAMDALINGAESGAWGAAGGAIGGGFLSYTGASLGGTLLSGAVAGGTTNSARSALQAYQETADWSEAGWAALDGLWKGAATGTVIAGASWGIGRVTERIVPLKGYPEHMTDPREKGILIRTKPGEREYGGMPAKPGYQRQHIKPLSLGGRDVPSNIEYMKNELHSTNPALGGGPQNAHPGQYVNSKPMGTIFY